MTLVLRRVAIIATLFLLANSRAWSKKNPDYLETYKDQINKSQVLLLQRDRKQATQVLISAINREGVGSPAYQELANNLNKSSEIFFSEKAQQAYEMALANFSESKILTVAKLQESLLVEPMNGLIMKALIFTQLSLGECGQATRVMADLEKLNPFNKDSPEIHLLILICNKNKVEGQATLAKLELSEIKKVFLSVNGQRLSPEGFSEVSENSAADQDYPEVNYLKWLAELDFKKKMALAEKYKNLCHTRISFDRAYSWLDPWVCDHLKEVENFHSKGERGN
jgi:hypothetical protein